MLAFALGVTIVPAPARAAAYPPYTPKWVHDFADILVDTEEAVVTDKFRTLAAETGVDVAAVTIGSVGDYQPGANFEAFATGLFNDWQLGTAGVNDGILLLVAVQDRKVRIELGDGFPPAASQQAAGIIDRMLERFRAGKYGLGIGVGADQIAYTFRSVASPPAGSPAPAVDSQGNPVDAPATGGLAMVPGSSTLPADQVDDGSFDGGGSVGSDDDGEGSGGGAGGLIAGLAGGGVLASAGGYTAWRRFRPRKCPQCDQPMVLVADGPEEAQFLEEGQLTEEEIGSVEHTVYRCPACQTRLVESRGRFFSGYHRCGSCGRKAVSRQRQTVVAATYSSSGIDRISEDCRSCGEHSEHEVTVARKVHHTRSSFGSSSSRSSGSSSGPSGGGHSSGGGASGSW